MLMELYLFRNYRLNQQRIVIKVILHQSIVVLRRRVTMTNPVVSSVHQIVLANRKHSANEAADNQQWN